MIKVAAADTSYLKYLHFSQYKHLIHFISTRVGGISSPPGRGLNVGFHLHDHPKNVIHNREILANALGISSQSFCFLNQVHGDNVLVVGQQERGRGLLDYAQSIPKTDAVVSNDRNTCLTVLSADCVGILFYDPVKQVIGAAHSGWRGTVKKIAAKTVQVMQEQFGTHPQDVLVGLGPAISAEMYGVGQEVAEAAEEAFGSTFQLISRNAYTGQLHFNLWQAIEQALLEIGVSAQNIQHSGICTYRNPSRFFSYRRDKGQTGRFATGIMLQ